MLEGNGMRSVIEYQTELKEREGTIRGEEVK